VFISILDRFRIFDIGSAGWFSTESGPVLDKPLVLSLSKDSNNNNLILRAHYSLEQFDALTVKLVKGVGESLYLRSIPF